jgi:hypothetical protein
LASLEEEEVENWQANHVAGELDSRLMGKNRARVDPFDFCQHFDRVLGSALQYWLKDLAQQGSDWMKTEAELEAREVLAFLDPQLPYLHL